jgi:site-specific recombinase XerC
MVEQAAPATSNLRAYHARFDHSGKGYRMILKEAIEQFLFHCRYEKNLSPKTLKAYSIDLRQVADFLIANLPATNLEAIDKTALRLYIKTLFTGLAEKTSSARSPPSRPCSTSSSGKT